MGGLGVSYCPGIIGALDIIATVCLRWVALELGGRGGGSHLLYLMNRLPSCLGWGGGLVMMAAPSRIFTYREIY